MKQSSSMFVLETILDIGNELIRSGAETHRAEDSLYRLCDSYGFIRCNIWVVPTNIQATVTSPEGEILTQIRSVRDAGIDFTKLEALNALCRYACEETPSADELRQRLSEICEKEPGKKWIPYLGAELGAGGLGFFFNCDLQDAAVCVGAALLIAFLGKLLTRRAKKPIILNFLLSFVSELFIVACVSLGFGHHIGYITIGVVMLMISGLGATNGVRDLVHLDALSGVIELTKSFSGAAGIALGMALPIILFGVNDSRELMGLEPDVRIQLVGCLVGCLGFSLWFRVRKWEIISCAFGSVLTWGSYLLARQVAESRLVCVIAATVVCAVYAQIMARIQKTPTTVFQTICIFPLIPGASLYYLMYGLVRKDYDLANASGINLAVTCAGIVLGFMVIEVVNRFFVSHKRGNAKKNA